MTAASGRLRRKEEKQRRSALKLLAIAALLGIAASAIAYLTDALWLFGW